MKKLIFSIIISISSFVVYSQAVSETINASTAGNAFAVKGVISSTSAGANSVGVRGENKGTAGIGYGVWGTHDGSGYGVYGSSTNGTGVYGSSFGSYGVFGTSTNGIGVAGLSGNIGLYGSTTNPNGFALKTDGKVFFSNGNVGIGTANPAYKLDVNVNGVDGIRIKSSSVPVLDIEAAENSNALVRYLKSGTIKWNLLCDQTNNFQINEQGLGNRFSIEYGTGKVYMNNNAQVVGLLSKGGGSFKIDHPLDPENKYLYHSFVESPDMMNIYNGNITTDANGKATIILPNYFEALNIDFRYQLTSFGSFAQAIVSKEIKDNSFEITTDIPNTKVSWMVTGVRNDAFAQKNRIPSEELKKDAEKGKYLHPTAFGKSETMKIGYSVESKNMVSSSNN
jgi:hypothetical protein